MWLNNVVESQNCSETRYYYHKNWPPEPIRPNIHTQTPYSAHSHFLMHKLDRFSQLGDFTTAVVQWEALAAGWKRHPLP